MPYIIGNAPPVITAPGFNPGGRWSPSRQRYLSDSDLRAIQRQQTLAAGIDAPQTDADTEMLNRLDTWKQDAQDANGQFDNPDNPWVFGGDEPPAPKAPGFGKPKLSATFTDTGETQEFQPQTRAPGIYAEDGSLIKGFDAPDRRTAKQRDMDKILSGLTDRQRADARQQLAQRKLGVNFNQSSQRTAQRRQQARDQYVKLTSQGMNPDAAQTYVNSVLQDEGLDPLGDLKQFAIQKPKSVQQVLAETVANALQGKALGFGPAATPAQGPAAPAQKAPSDFAHVQPQLKDISGVDLADNSKTPLFLKTMDTYAPKIAPPSGPIPGLTQPVQQPQSGGIGGLSALLNDPTLGQLFRKELGLPSQQDIDWQKQQHDIAAQEAQARIGQLGAQTAAAKAESELKTLQASETARKARGELNPTERAARDVNEISQAVQIAQNYMQNFPNMTPDEAGNRALAAVNRIRAPRGDKPLAAQDLGLMSAPTDTSPQGIIKAGQQLGGAPEDIALKAADKVFTRAGYWAPNGHFLPGMANTLSAVLTENQGKASHITELRDWVNQNRDDILQQIKQDGVPQQYAEAFLNRMISQKM